MEKEIGIDFPGSTLDDSAFYKESYSNEEDEFVQEGYFIDNIIDLFPQDFLISLGGPIGAAIAIACGNSFGIDHLEKAFKCAKNRDEKGFRKQMRRAAQSFKRASITKIINKEKVAKVQTLGSFCDIMADGVYNDLPYKKDIENLFGKILKDVCNMDVPNKEQPNSTADTDVD
jgi:hypothetical protein